MKIVPISVDLLTEVIKYIEEAEVMMESEGGVCRDLQQLEGSRELPDLLYKLRVVPDTQDTSPEDNLSIENDDQYLDDEMKKDLKKVPREL